MKKLNNSLVQLPQLNPQHTVPTLVDGDDSIWDSHAIVVYLAEKYAGNSALYPKDLITRARIQQRLHFDSGLLFPPMRIANSTIIFGGVVDVAQDHLDAMSSALDMTEQFLQHDDYLVGNQVTLADFCCVSTILALDYHIPLATRYPKTNAWLQRLSRLPYFDELSIQANKQYRALLDARREQNKTAQ